MSKTVLEVMLVNIFVVHLKGTNSIVGAINRLPITAIGELFAQSATLHYHDLHGVVVHVAGRRAWREVVALVVIKNLLQLSGIDRDAIAIGKGIEGSIEVKSKGFLAFVVNALDVNSRLFMARQKQTNTTEC